MYIHFDDIPDGVEFSLIYPTPRYIKHDVGDSATCSDKIVATSVTGFGGNVRRSAIDRAMNGYVYIDEVTTW